MKNRSIIFSLLFLVGLGATRAAFAQQGCDFNILGTWREPTTDVTNSVLYRFAADGTVTALSASGSGQAGELRAIGRAVYELDDPRSPQSITFKASPKGGVFGRGAYSMKIIKYDDASFTCVKPRSRPTQWVRVDPNRYFIVLAARTGEFYDGSGSAFPMLIKLIGRETQVEGVGTYSINGQRAFGPVPPEAYKDFMREPRTDSEVMLRLEINAAQYERGLKILRTWERRVREDALLYTTGSYLNNVLLVKAVTETLNQCSEEIKIYNLNYVHPEDWIAEQYAPPFIPFAYFKELRRLNQLLHVRDDRFQQATHPAMPPQGH
jgi:hypothetical protein